MYTEGAYSFCNHRPGMLYYWCLCNPPESDIHWRRHLTRRLRRCYTGLPAQLQPPLLCCSIQPFDSMDCRISEPDGISEARCIGRYILFTDHGACRSIHWTYEGIQCRGLWLSLWEYTVCDKRRSGRYTHPWISSTHPCLHLLQRIPLYYF